MGYLCSGFATKPNEEDDGPNAWQPAAKARQYGQEDLEHLRRAAHLYEAIALRNVCAEIAALRMRDELETGHRLLNELYRASGARRDDVEEWLSLNAPIDR
jgi:hypothetical protein